MSDSLRKAGAIALVIAAFGLCLMRGGNSPFGIAMYSVFTTLVLGVMILSLIGSRSPMQVRALGIPAVLFLLVCGWAWLQATTGYLPDLAHPVWGSLEDVPASIAADPASARFATMRLLAFGAVFFCLVVASEDADNAALLMRLIAILCTLITAYGLIAYTLQINPILGDLANGKSVTATFVNRNSFALFAAFGAIANLAAFTDETAGVANDLYEWLMEIFSTSWLYTLGFLICTGALFLSFSRAGILSALLGILAFVIFWNISKGKRANLVMIGLAAVVVGIAAIANASKVVQRLLATNIDEARFAVFPSILEAIKDRPLQGHGIGSFHDAFRPYVPESAAFGEWSFAHNTYLETVMELGIPAAAVFYIALGLVLFRIYRGTRRHQFNRTHACFAFGCSIAVATHALVDFSIQLPGNTALWAIILGIGFGRSFSTLEIKKHNDRA